MVLFPLTLPQPCLYEYSMSYFKATHYKMKREQRATRGPFCLWPWLTSDSNKAGTKRVCYVLWASLRTAAPAPAPSVAGRTWWRGVAGPSRPFPALTFMAQDGTGRTSSWRERGRYINFVPSSFREELEVIVRNRHLLLSKPLGWQRNEPSVNPSSMFGGKRRQNMRSGQQLVLPQAPDCAEKSIGRLCSPETWASLKGHISASEWF